MMPAVEKLRHYAGAATELQRLRDRVEELEELLGISEALRPDIGITPHNVKVLLLLCKRELIGPHAIILALNATERSYKYADVRMVHVRRILREHDIILHNQRGVGWYVKAADKPKLRSILRGSQP